MRQVSVDLAHELKTPMSRLCILLDEAIARLSNQDSRTALDDALSEAMRINETFEALLRIAQIESGTRRSKFVDFDLGDLVASTFDVFEPVAEEKGQSLTLQHGHEPLNISGDPQLIVQLVANLIENAIRHCPPKASICVEAKRSDERCQIVVSDDGPGIPTDEHSKVFERLYRLEKSRTTNGSGLGLSLVKAITDLHRASITLLDNEPGLKVRVSFPAPDDADLTKL
jgi:signal transduction histidine kinase